MEMFILCQEDIFAIPLCAKGCVADLGLYLAGYNVQAGQADLSGFGFEADQWVTLRCEVRDRHVQLFVNGKKAHEASFPNKPTPLVGISYEFEGTGSVDYTRFSRPDGEVVYEDDFNALEARASSDQ
jgi:hypothetical protein